MVVLAAGTVVAVVNMAVVIAGVDMVATATNVVAPHLPIIGHLADTRDRVLVRTHLVSIGKRVTCPITLIDLRC